MAQVIAVHRGTTLMSSGVSSQDVNPVDLGINISDMAKADVRLTGVTPFVANALGGGIPPLDNEEYSVWVTLINETTLRFQSGVGVGTPFRNISWEIWEYVGPVGGPNEIIFMKQEVDDKQAIAAGSIDSTIGSLWTGVTDFTTADNPDVLSFNRGLDWISGGTATTPAAGNITMHNDIAFGLPFSRFTRGDTNGNPEIHYTAVWFKGSNWNVQLDIVPTVTPLGIAQERTLTNSVQDWKKAFIYAQRRSNGLANATQGMIVWPGTAADATDPTQYRILYPTNGSTNVFNACVVQVVDNQQLFDSVSDDSITGAGTTFLAASLVEDVAVTIAGTAFTSGALFVTGGNGDGANSAGAQAWVVELEAAQIAWQRGIASNTDVNWSHVITDFTVEDAVPALFPLFQADNDLGLIQAANDLGVIIALNDQEVIISDPTQTVVQAGSDLSIEIADANMTVIVVTGGVANVALFNLCPVTDSICVSLLNTRPFGFTLKDTLDAPIDITGGSFKFTVSRDEDPTTTANEIVQIAGVITDGPNGVFQFTPTLVDPTRFNEVGEFFYDVEYTDVAGAIYTLLKGGFEVKQTITDPATL